MGLLHLGWSYLIDATEDLEFSHSPESSKLEEIAHHPAISSCYQTAKRLDPVRLHVPSSTSALTSLRDTRPITRVKTLHKPMGNIEPDKGGK